MKCIVIAVFAVLFSLPTAYGQFRGTEPRPPAVSEKIASPSQHDLLLGFINPSNFSMSHSISMSYVSLGSAGLGVTRYVNSMRYQLSEPLSLRADVGFMFSPFGSAAGLLKNDVNKVYLERAQLDYKPSKDFSVSLQFRQLPEGLMYPYSGRYADPRYGMYSPFGDDIP